MGIRLRRLAVALAMLPLLVACSSDSTSEPTGSGDCNVQVRVGDLTYSTRDSVDQDAPVGKELGTGSVLDCDGSALEKVSVYQVSGFNPNSVVAIEDDDARRYNGVYVNLQTPDSSWPLNKE